MIRRPPRSTLDRSSAASDVYKRQVTIGSTLQFAGNIPYIKWYINGTHFPFNGDTITSVSYTHLRAHETVLDLVCRLLLETKNNTTPT